MGVGDPHLHTLCQGVNRSDAIDGQRDVVLVGVVDDQVVGLDLAAAHHAADGGSNVVVVRPTKAAREAGARPVRLGGVLTDEAVESVAEWVLACGAGRAGMPHALTGHVLDRWAEGVASE